MKRALLILLAACLLPVLAVAGFYGYENWAGSQAWARAERMLEAAGEPLTAEALRPAAVPDADNMAAAPIFHALFTFGSAKRAPVCTLCLPPPAEADGDLNGIAALARRFDAGFSGDSASAAQVVMDGIAPMQPMLDAVRAAAARPDVVWPVNYNRGFALRMPFLSPLRQAAEVLAANAAADMAQGRPEMALGEFEVIARLAHSSRQPSVMLSCAAEQIILGHALEIVRDGLVRGSWSDGDLWRLEAELAGFHPMDSFRESIRGERALFLASPEELNARAEPLFTIIDFQSVLSEWVTRVACRVAWALRPAGWTELDRARYATFSQDWLDRVIQDDCIRPWALADWNARLHEVRRNSFEAFRTPLTVLALPSFNAVARMTAYAQSQVDLTRLACALELCRRETGGLPDSLATLAPRWIDRIPRDVIGGDQYIYRPSGGGHFILYGRGWNARDDGGSSAHVNALLGPASADDWVWNADSGRISAVDQ
ncbi:MAG TPA: hypothetical protein VIM48_03355 [Chthoniobacterales bacterium]